MTALYHKGAGRIFLEPPETRPIGLSERGCSRSRVMFTRFALGMDLPTGAGIGMSVASHDVFVWINSVGGLS